VEDEIAIALHEGDVLAVARSHEVADAQIFAGRDVRTLEVLARDAVDCQHVEIDPTLVVSDPEESALTPAGTPAVLADPALVGVVVSDRTYTVSAEEGGGGRGVDATGVVHEVVVHAEAGDQW